MRIVVCTPVYSHAIDWEHLKCLEALAGMLPPGCLGTSRVHGCALIDQARCIITEQALDQGADVLLWLDDDILFDANDALMLVRACRVGEHDIIGAACSTKVPGGKLCCEFPPDTRTVPFFDAGGIYPVTSIGLGFTAIHRRVFDRLARDLPQVVGATGHQIRPYFASEIIDGVWYGEDYSFCRKAQRAGFRTFVDTRLRSFHKGRYCYRVEDTIIHVPPVGRLSIDMQTKLGVLEQAEAKQETG